MNVCNKNIIEVIVWVAYLEYLINKNNFADFSYFCEYLVRKQKKSIFGPL